MEGTIVGDTDVAIDGDTVESEEGVNEGCSGVVTVGVSDGSMLRSVEGWYDGFIVRN